MDLADLAVKIKSRVRREVSVRLARRLVRMRNKEPIISFTFDDFPRSALFCGGEILHRYGVAGTYFVSFGLMGQHSPTGEIFMADDLPTLVCQGHEIGCHTFDHCHSWETSRRVFEESIARNRTALARYLPTATFQSLSYPISGPRYETKRQVGQQFACCRGGGQSGNVGTADLNYLAAVFIEQCSENFQTIERLIEANARQKGWLIFATHDVSETPTQFGCTPEMFETTVRCSLDSGAKILPIHEALQSIDPQTVEVTGDGPPVGVLFG